MRNTKLKTIVIITVIRFFATEMLYAANHASTSKYRSNGAFFSQSISSEFGKVTTSGNKKAISPLQLNPSKSDKSSPVPAGKADWKGTSTRSDIGLQMLNFVQLSLGQSFVDLSSSRDGLESLKGTRVMAELKLVFASPMGNLEVGGGKAASRYDYRNRLNSAEFYGNGLFSSVGVNYFLGANYSIFGNMTSINETLFHSSGSDQINRITTDTKSFGLGVRIKF